MRTTKWATCIHEILPRHPVRKRKTTTTITHICMCVWGERETEATDFPVGAPPYRPTRRRCARDPTFGTSSSDLRPRAQPSPTLLSHRSTNQLTSPPLSSSRPLILLSPFYLCATPTSERRGQGTRLQLITPCRHDARGCSLLRFTPFYTPTSTPGKQWVSLL